MDECTEQNKVQRCTESEAVNPVATWEEREASYLGRSHRRARLQYR